MNHIVNESCVCVKGVLSFSFCQKTTSSIGIKYVHAKKTEFQLSPASNTILVMVEILMKFGYCRCGARTI